MKTNILRYVALTVGLSAGTAYAQYTNYGYTPPPPGYGTQPVAPQQNAVPIHPSLMVQNNQQAYRQPTMPSPQYPVGAVGTQVQMPPQNYAPQPAYVPQVGYNSYSTPRALPALNNRVAMNDDLLNGGATYGQPLPAPQPTPAPQYQPAPQGMPYQGTAPVPQPMPAGDPGCTSCGNGGVSAYSQATMSPGWEGGSCNSCGPAPVTMAAPVGLRNWFGSAGVMIMDVVDNCDRPLVHDVAAPATTVLRSSDAGFDTLTGGSFSIGRYIGCGRYAIVGNYWFINPDSSATTINVPGGGDYRSVFPQWDRAYVDLNNDNAENVGEDMYALYDAATAYRITRDIDIQNVEVSMIGFGIGGASRVGVPGCNSVGCGGSAFSQAFSSGGCGSSCGSCNTCAPALGCAGGPCGPLVPSCSCRLRASYGHGIRWFRFKDNLEFAASLAQPGYGNTNDDMYYTVDVTNDLIGYQFTGRLDYCVGNRLSLYAGGKTGLYVNNIDYRSTLGTGALRAVADAYYPAFQGQNVMVDASETELAFLAELDLGANFNLTPCWTINGGYRIMGVSGLATSAGQFSVDPANLGVASDICSTQSLLLHGAYVGATYNW